MSDAPLTKETMFRLSYSEAIECVEVIKKTSCFVTFAYKDWMGRRCESRERGDKFYPTWEAAKQALISDYENKIRWKRDEIHRLESRLGQIRKMQEPRE